MEDLSGANLLLLLRDMGDTDWLNLCNALGIDPAIPLGAGFASLPSVTLFNHLFNLKKAGLVQIEKHPALDPYCKIRVSERFAAIKRALGISLTDVAKSTEHSSMVLTPIFGKPSKFLSPTDVFVLMPFLTTLKPVYDDHIIKVAKELGLTVTRADDFFTTRSVMRDIWEAICASKIIIADCTGRNPNVFYEIGLSHVVGKPVVLITQNSEDVPFDLRHLRYILYEFTPRGMETFEAVLTKTLAEVLRPPYKEHSDTGGA
jgi:hypothetical protein